MRNRVRATQAPVDDAVAERVATQKTAGPGNQALARQLAHGAVPVGGGVVQAKLSVGPAGDRYEREADAVADAVTAPSADAQRQGPDEDELQMSRIQRQEGAEMEDEELQLSRIQRQSPEDEELQMSRVQRQEGAEMEDEELQLSRIQRQSPKDEELQMSRIGRVSDEEMGIGPEGGDLDATTEKAISQASGSGRPLDAAVRRDMESSFGADFSSVRVHTGPDSDTLNASMGARAFTRGSDVFVRSGDYAPGSPAGKHLLAHELTHVVQQGAAPTRRLEEK